MSNLIMEIKDLCLVYKQKPEQKIIEVKDLKIQTGDIIFINGKNGSGKSSLLNYLFTSVNKPKYVDVISQQINMYLDGTKEDESHKHIIYLSQKDDMNSNMSVYKSLTYPTEVALNYCSLEPFKSNKKHYIKELNEKVTELITEGIECKNALFFEMFSSDKKFNSLGCNQRERALEILKNKKSDKLSGGQKKMVRFLAAYIKACIMESSILILDEPLNHIDLGKIKQISSLVSKIAYSREKKPLSLIIISHLMAFDFIKETNVKQYRIDEETKTLMLEKNIIDHSIILKDM